MINHKEEIEYLMLFKNIHDEPPLTDFYVDYENWKINEDGTGYSNIWLEPKKQLIYKPTFKSPFEEIEIKGLRIMIKTKVLTIEGAHKVVNFQISGNFNPHIWRGRNNLIVQPIDKTVVSGYTRLIFEQDNFFSPYFLKYIEKNYSNFILEAIHFYSQNTY